MSAQIYLPSIATGEIGYSGADGDTVYVYSGGWGANAEALDAGFQHNPSTDNWSLFIRYQGAGFVFAEGDPRFTGGRSVQLTVFVPEDGTINALASGTLITGLTQQVSLEFSNGVTGWTADGTDQVLKRMTSIAQNVESFTTGSFVHNVQWSNVMIGTTSGSKAPWLSAQTGGQCMHPSAQEDPNVIVVQFINQANEIDNITLSAG
jgi:hypothetical protein